MDTIYYYMKHNKSYLKLCVNLWYKLTYRISNMIEGMSENFKCFFRTRLLILKIKYKSFE